MKLFFAQYRLPYPLYVSGADKYTIELANWLAEQGNDVEGMFSMGFYSFKDIEKKCKSLGLSYTIDRDRIVVNYSKFLTFSIFTPDSFFTYYFKFLKDNKDTCVFHYLNVFIDSNNNLHNYDQWKTMFNVKAKQTCYIHSEDILDDCFEFKDRFDLVFCNSRYIQSIVEKKWGRKAIIILPLPNQDCVFDIKQDTSDYITFFNPTQVKGIDIISKLVKHNSHRLFMIVLGWSSRPKLPDDIVSAKHVLVVPAQKNVAEIYSYSRLVVVPSQWEEPFGRVVIEAAYNNIPVCISDVGGMKQYFDGNGVLVKNYKDISAWQDAIDYLDNEDHYKTAVKNCLKIRDKLDYSKENHKLLSELKKLF